jgi:hypothetical protein
VTPYAAQRASFHEKGRPDAWAVVDGISLDVEDIHCRFLFVGGLYPPTVQSYCFFCEMKKESGTKNVTL